MKFIVVGGGIMGLSAAWAAQRAGHQVTLYEQGTIPNPLGSSADQHRLIRYPYGSDEGYCKMVGEAFRAWDQLWSDLGKTFYKETGTLILGSGEDTWAERSVTVLRRLGITFQTITPDQLEFECPLLITEKVKVAYSLDTGGVLFSKPILQTLSQHLIKQGVELHTGTKVCDIDQARPSITLADGTVISGDKLVIAAGPWTPYLLRAFSSRITPSRQVLVYSIPPRGHTRHWARAPMILDIGSVSGFYAVPPVFTTDLKFGFHSPTLTGHPDRDRTARNEEARAVFEMARARFRDYKDYRMTDARTCFYSIAAGERFIVERVENSWVLGGFSGHGFKFAPLIGIAVIGSTIGECKSDEVTNWASGRAMQQPRIN